MALTKATNNMISGALVNVLDFGATGDGATDDTAAIHNAISSLPSGGTVFFPIGIYKCALTITQYNIILKGAGKRSTQISNNTSLAGTYAINVDLGAQNTTKLPMSFGIEDMAITGDRVNNYHAIYLANVKSGSFRGLEINEVGHGIYLSNTFNVSFSDIFFRQYGVGIQGNFSLTSNNQTFTGMHFFGGNTDNNAVPLYTNGMSDSTFINCIFEGSEQMASTKLYDGSGNTFIQPRFESCTARSSTNPYLILGGNRNRIIHPLVTQLGVEALASKTYLVQITGTSCEVDGIEMGAGIRVLELTASANNCKVKFSTTGLSNTILKNLWVDYGDNNLINCNNSDFTYDNQTTWSEFPVTNYFSESTDMSSVTTDGLTQATVVGAPSRTGPFEEGLIEKFTSPTGNRRWYQDVFPLMGSPAANTVIGWSVFVRSLTSGGEDVVFQMGRLASLVTVDTINIPDTKFVRVSLFSKTDTSAYTDFNVCAIAAVGGSGLEFYGNQVIIGDSQSAGLYGAFYSGGYVPTESVAVTDLGPHYASDRRHKISPVNGTGVAGQYIKKIKPVVGQPKGWYCTVSGNAGTWVSEGNL